MIENKQRAIFLDRDGVINRAPVLKGMPHSPATLAEVEILPGVVEALDALHSVGLLLIVVTNQPNVKRGLTSLQDVEDINDYLLRSLPLDDLYTCLHVDEDHCSCRKPKPGMLFDAASKYDIVMHESYMIGDRWRDIEAGFQAGCKTIFIDYNYEERRPEQIDARVCSLYEAARFIIKDLGNSIKMAESHMSFICF